MDASSDAARGPRLRGQLLLLRGRAGLSQRALAAQLGISEHAIAHWEAGRGYPSAARLQALIALYVERHVFLAGREAEEARALWAALRREGGQRAPPFDEAWFATLPRPEPADAAVASPAAGAAGGAAGAEPPEPLVQAGGPSQDWGEAPEV